MTTTSVKINATTQQQIELLYQLTKDEERINFMKKPPPPPEYESFLMNCTVISRPGENQGPLFFLKDDNVVAARLYGYTILPSEDYEALLARLKKIEEILYHKAPSFTNSR
jgi:hypothetical protein